MHKYLLLLLILVTAAAANSQNVMNSGDVAIAYNSAKSLGDPANPVTPATGVMAKWIHDINGTRINWDESKFKCYIWNGMAFRLRFPNNYDSTNPAKYPLILFFHGGGEAHPIHDNEDHLYWGAQTFQTMINSNQSTFNGFLLFPQEASVGWGDAQFQVINGILDTLEKYNDFDPNRLITMGLSEGGFGSLDMASLYPKRVSTVVSSSPIDATTINNITNYIHVPVWMANGGTDTDPVVDVANNYFNSFHNAGGNIVQQFYATQGHSIWTQHWAMLDITNYPILERYWATSSKTQPLVYFNNTQFCQGSPISARMGVTAGFYAYQWQISTHGGAFADIPGATGNEYTATQAGLYRVHFKRLATSDWSIWTPAPVAITTKPCSLDTLFTEHFEYDDPTAYTYFAPSPEYKRYNFNCMNGVFITGADNFTNDATGRNGGRFSLNYTYSNSGCTYSAADKVWGQYLNQPAVKQNTNYLFSFYAGNQTTTTALASLVPSVNGTKLTNLLSKPAALNSSFFGNNSWTKFTYAWNSGSATSADLAILNNSTNTNGNDFVLDEISFTKLLAPGGFGTNMSLWAKADVLPMTDSTRMNDWANSTGATELTQLTVNQRPLLRNNSTDNINFNPLVNFSAANTMFMNATGGYAGTGTHNQAHVFVVARSVDSTTTDSLLIERGNSSTNRVAISLPIKTGNIVWDAGATTGASHLTAPAIYSDLNKPVLYTFSKDIVNGTGSGNSSMQDIRRNGVVLASTTTAGAPFIGNNQAFKMGLSNAKVAEVIYYLDANINADRQNRIESYLATKYGMTLGTRANPISYKASDSSTIFWTASATYQNDVFGIGVDSVSGLNQLQSNSINSGSGDGTGQTGKGNLILTAISALGDKDFLMIGNDSTTLAEHIIVPGEAPSAAQSAVRVGREWKVRNTGNVGAVTLTFDTTGLTLAGGNTLGNYALMIDSDGDGDFTTGSIRFFFATSSSNKQLNFSGVTFHDNEDFTIITQHPAGSLPATWLGFTAQYVSGNALLDWQTSEEINVDYYAVEHSTNGLDFTVIGVKPANNGLSVNDYTYTQQSLSAGMHYYRIRRVDRDGVFSYSDVKTIKVSAVNAIQIRPNPVTGSTLTLGISLQQSAKAVIQVVSIDGKVMLKTNTTLAQGINTVNLNVDAIPTGIYLVQVQMNDDAVTKKFIRTH